VRDIVTIDFETEAIEDRPHYPPRPVGVAIKGRGVSTYLAWGHPEGNNCNIEGAREALQAIWADDVDLLFHNAKFDIDVAETWMDVDMPSWDRVHDTMFLLYLYNPHARTVALKPASENLLDWPAEERDELHDWIMAYTGCTRKKKAGAWIAHAPAELVGRYAKGDTDRTSALFNFLMPYIEENEMLEAYNRERQLMPILLESERHGILVDTARLTEDLHSWEANLIIVDTEIMQTMGITDPDIIGSPKQLGDALEAKGLADPTKWLPTKKGHRSVSKDSLGAAVDNKRLLGLLGYRGALKNALSTFLRPWHGLTVGQNYDRLHTSWHQVRNPEGYGTRTGRISSTRPNFANVPNEYDAPPEGYPELPLVRSYLLPDKGHVWLKRDYSAQEIRILAHFEDGSLMEAFKEDANMDPHAFAAALIEEVTTIKLNRGATKIIAFSICYGKGTKMLAVDLGVEYPMGFQLKQGYFDAFPGIKDLSKDVKDIGDEGSAVRTVGGRLMYAEPPINGRRFSYKLLNHLIQGSASDLTKQGIIDYYDQGGVGHLLAQVYDEVNLSVPVSYVRYQNDLLETAMAGIELALDVPLTSDLYIGETWHDADGHKNPDLGKYLVEER
jgi:DNA polymerase I-like protein with 3'-5' exonuclease and polymerase domains